MLKDYVRTNAYKKAILGNAELFKDKVHFSFCFSII